MLADHKRAATSRIPNHIDKRYKGGDEFASGMQSASLPRHLSSARIIPHTLVESKVSKSCFISKKKGGTHKDRFTDIDGFGHSTNADIKPFTDLLANSAPCIHAHHRKEKSPHSWAGRMDSRRPAATLLHLPSVHSASVPCALRRPLPHPLPHRPVAALVDLPSALTARTRRRRP